MAVETTYTEDEYTVVEVRTGHDAMAGPILCPLSQAPQPYVIPPSCTGVQVPLSPPLLLSVTRRTTLRARSCSLQLKAAECTCPQVPLHVGPHVLSAEHDHTPVVAAHSLCHVHAELRDVCRRIGCWHTAAWQRSQWLWHLGFCTLAMHSKMQGLRLGEPSASPRWVAWLDSRPTRVLG